MMEKKILVNSKIWKIQNNLIEKKQITRNPTIFLNN